MNGLTSLKTSYWWDEGWKTQSKWYKDGAFCWLINSKVVRFSFFITDEKVMQFWFGDDFLSSNCSAVALVRGFTLQKTLMFPFSTYMWWCWCFRMVSTTLLDPSLSYLFGGRPWDVGGIPACLQSAQSASICDHLSLWLFLASPWLPAYVPAVLLFLAWELSHPFRVDWYPASFH